jgi:hypothetical protein
MRVNNPNWRWGKVVLEYKGSSESTRDVGIKLQRAQFCEKVMVTSDTDEELVYKLTLLDDTKIMASFVSSNIYYKDDKPDAWVLSENSFVFPYRKLIDPELIIIQGEIRYRKSIGIQIYQEKYIFTMIFSNIQGIMDKLLHHEALQHLQLYSDK